MSVISNIRNFEEELSEIKKEHINEKKLVETNTKNLIENSKELVLFYIKRELILENKPTIEGVILYVLGEIYGDVVFNNFNYQCSVLRGFDGSSSKMVTFFSYFLLSEAKVDGYDFRDGIIEIINSFGFIVSFEEEISNV
ncbi:hypothetical protein BS46_gp06 [Acinetobacter phage BS46]|nr:hypothetical protein BS46_gp06 [Acinetobacter phage BS46]